MSKAQLLERIVALEAQVQMLQSIVAQQAARPVVVPAPVVPYPSTFPTVTCASSLVSETDPHLMLINAEEIS